MTGNYLIEGALVAIGANLVGIALPDKTELSPRFVRFQAALVLYPGVVMVFLALGAAELIMAFVGP